MTIKRTLALLLTLCLIFSVMSPAAAAVQSVPAQTVQQGKEAKPGNAFKDRLNAVGEALGIKTLRDEQPETIDREDMSFKNGKWTATISDGTTIDLTEAQLPEDVQALRKVANQYSAEDMVYVFVTLEAAPAVETYSSIHDVPNSLTTQLLQQQENVIASIEKNVLGNKELNVVSQFTYLTNSIVVETQFGNLEAIAAMPGVKSVFISPVYYPCETSDVVYPATESSTLMSDVAAVWQDLGYTGEGMTIAILDTGLDLDHPSFAADPVGAAWDAEWLQEMLDTYDLRLEELYGEEITAEDLYYSAKVPFAFNYASGTTDVLHDYINGDHGSHVAGISAANKVEGTGVVGMAPDAQIIAMKVFGPSGGASMYSIIEALQDCMILGVDVVNMSLGSPAGFTDTDVEEIDSIFQRIAESDMIVDVAAGNEGTSSYGSTWGYNMQLTQHIENGTMSSPATYANSLAVGSVDNNLVPADYFKLADGTKVFYQHSVEVLMEYTDIALDNLVDAGELEYVMVPNLGNAEDFYDENGYSIVAGKIAVVSRGEITFGEKCANAEAAGALAVMIWDNVSEDIFSFGMTTTYTGEDGTETIPGIPAVLITLEDGQAMADAETKTITVPSDFAYRVDANGGQMSSFSCWGTTSDLRLMPDISGVGGNVYSCYDDGQYGLMSGTSMATPQVAGVTALVLQYLKEQFPDATEAEIRVLVDSLMMSTAVAVIADSENNVEASPRQQGAGLVNAYNAISAKAYLSVEGSERPKAELKDNVNGEFSFTFTVHNFSNAEKTYNLRASLLCEDYIDYYGYYMLAEQDKALDNSAVTFSSDTVTVAAGGTAEVTVTIKLTDADKEWINTYFPSGNYVEGFVYLEGEGEVTLSLPFMGFYGRWDAAPLFDSGFWYDDGMWLGEIGYITANQYSHMLWTNVGASNWVLGMNPYTGVDLETGASIWYDEAGYPHVYYNPANNVISPNGDGALDAITEIYISLMRNAEELEMIYTDAEGNELDYRYFWKESKTMYISGYGSVVPMVYSWTYDDVYDFADLEDGDVVYLTISGVIDYEGAEADVLLDKMPIYIDTTAPVLDTTKIVESSDENGNYITLTFTEAHPAAVITMNTSGTQIYEYYSDMEMTANEDGTYTVTVDVTDLGDKFAVALCDYGCNEVVYDLTWSEPGANNPEMDETALYAYQVYHEYFGAYYGFDAMFGWATIDKESAETTMISSDMYEYYALNAAEYVDGYIFAVDAGGNFLYMTPGIWSRTEICNIGLNVVDMAFDETTGKMYLATNDSENYSSCLYTIDLLTGELTQLWDYGSQYSVPWAMTFVDGKLYATKYYYGGLYEVDLETYELVAVTDAEGNPIDILDAYEETTRPYYGQSMTYSEADGVIYWAYYNGNGCQLLTINPTDWTNTAAAMAWDSEYVGLLMLDGEYTLPESTEVTRVVLSEQQVIMGSNQQKALSANALPWNLPDDVRALTWKSSNEDVATVDENGVVTAVAEGTATITASCSGLEASCQVIVVDISGTLNAYDYISADGSYGNWLNIDLGNMTERAVAASPVDFIAADYNGHTGIIYGYDTNGQCYWYNPAEGTCEALGVADSSKVPADMAYDYFNGLMYVLVLDYNTGENTLYLLNMNTGALLEVAETYGLMTLACSTYGMLYGMGFDGVLYELWLVEDDGMGGGGIMPWSSVYAVGDGVTEYMIQTIPLAQAPVYGLQYAQSMCYDHNNEVILWVNPETSRIYWIDGLYSDDGNVFFVDLGDSSGSGLIEYTGTFVVPEEIPQLEPAYISNVVAEDMMVLLGGSKPAAVNIYPFNATVQTVSSWESSNPEVAYVDENGMVVGAGLGNATITATVVDFDDHEFVVEFNVAVKQTTGSLYAYMMQDIAAYNGYFWFEMTDTDSKNYMPVSYVEYNGAYMTLYAAEYVNGYIYAYGFDDQDWTANFQFLTIDPETWEVVNGVDMGDEFPFVYDMAFDYTTGAMLAVAGSQTSTNLYYVNLANGELVECVLFDEKMFLNLAVDANGTVYVIESSVEDFDPMTWMTTYSNAMMYTVDIENGTCELFLDTGVISNQVSSMTYDYDTGYIYWVSLNSMYQGGLKLIDLEEKAVYALGTVGASASQISGLISFAEEYPEIPAELSKLLITSTLEEIREGDTVALETFVLPATAQVEVSWESDNESVATVDENGVVTGVSAGSATITVTAENGMSASCKIVVHGEEGYFITYNLTDGGFSAIYRPNPTVVVNFTEGEDAPTVTALTTINGIIFAYDEDNNLFYTCANQNFERTYIGNCGIELDEPYEESNPNATATYVPNFVVRDMAWDETNDRLLAVGAYGVNATYAYADGYTYEEYFEYDAGCGLYEVNVKTGELSQLCIIGSEAAPETGVHMLEVTDEGKVFVYSTFMDWVSVLDTETGAVTNVATLQNQGVYGSSDGDLMSMTYDAETNLIYMLFTSNGKWYQLFTLNVNTGAMSRVENIGEVIYDEDTWSYIADAFAGIVVNEEHICQFTDAALGQNGDIVYQCICGETKILAEAITTLEEAVADLEAAIAAGDQELSDEVAAMKTALQGLTAAYQAADASLRTELSAQIASANSAIQALSAKMSAELAAAEEELAAAIAAGDKALEDQIAEMNAALEAATAVSNAAEEAMKAEIAALEAAIAAGDKALEDKIAALEAANEALKAELNQAITDAVATLNAAIAQVQKNLDDAKAELNAKDDQLAAKDNELAAKDDALAAKDAQLNKLVVVAIVIASIGVCGCVALLVFMIVDKRKKV